MSQSPDIIVVCTANICRSPMGAALLKHALAGKPEPLSRLTVGSAGVSARRGEPVTEYSAMALKKVGIDISDHHSQPLTQQMLDQAKLILCMTESHRDMIQLTAEPVPKHLYLFREFMKDGPKEIPDPYGGPYSLYETSRDEMVEAIPSIVEFLKTEFSVGAKK
jgi:protein-tyrosine-phosphatase